MTDRPIDVAFCFDDHLALPGAAALLSLLDTNPGVRVHIVTDPEPNAAPLLRSIAQRKGAEMVIVDRAPERDHGVDRESDYGCASTATYRRAFLPGLLPDLDRVIYLDADLIVRSSLAELWSTDLAGAALGAVEDPWMATIPAMRAPFPTAISMPASCSSPSRNGARSRLPSASSRISAAASEPARTRAATATTRLR